jgi:hypothetical protein
MGKDNVRVWRGFRFEVPPGLSDETTLAFADPEGPRPSHTVTVGFLPRGDAKDLKAYVASQLKHLESSLRGYKVKGTRDAEVGGAKAIVVEQQATLDNETIAQVQTYVDDGQQVVVLTASSRPGSKQTAQALMESVVKSFKREAR